jgi:tetratricopeptide (TPR) repeat protein
MAYVDSFGAAMFPTSSRTAQFAAAESALTRVLSLEPEHAFARTCLGGIQIITKRVDQGIAECEQALSLSANEVSAHAFVGLGKIYLGRSEETEAHIREAFRLSPRDTFAYLWLSVAAVANLHLGNDAEAAIQLRRSIKLNGNNPIAHFHLAAALANLEQLDEARSAVAIGLAQNSTFTLRQYRASGLGDNPTYLAQRQRIAEGLRKAGVPD